MTKKCRTRLCTPGVAHYVFVIHFFVAIISKRGANAQEPLATFQQDVRKTEYNFNFLALTFPR